MGPVNGPSFRFLQKHALSGKLKRIVPQYLGQQFLYPFYCLISKQDHTPPEAFRLRLAKCLLTLVWLAIIAVCLLHKDEFTLEGILSYTPRQPVLAAAMLWALFAVKSLSIFLYSGLLYAASGILFPLPVAIAVNIAGTAVMVSIPYWLGKKLGSQAVQYILHRFAKSAMLHDLRGGSDFFFVLIARLLGILSADVVSGYMGAAGVRYKDYLPACLLGLLSACILFPIMGMSLSDIRSPNSLSRPVFSWRRC